MFLTRHGNMIHKHTALKELHVMDTHSQAACDAETEQYLASCLALRSARNDQTTHSTLTYTAQASKYERTEFGYKFKSWLVL